MADKLNEQNIIGRIKTSTKTLSFRILVNDLLAEFDHQLLYETVDKYMDNSSIQTQEWIVCITTLCRIDPNRANKRFSQVLQTEADLDKRGRVLILLKDCGTKIIVPTLIELLQKENDADMRFLMIVALGNIGDERAIEILKNLAQNDNDINYEGEKISDVAERMLKIIQRMNG